MTGTWTAPRLGTALGRALRRRCPRCGERRIFRRWVTMAEDCPQCALHFERIEGYWLGSITLNLIATEGAFVALLVAGIVTTWPDVPWNGLLAGLVGVNLVLPVLLHPFSRTVWVAGERHFHGWAEPGRASDGAGYAPRG